MNKYRAMLYTAVTVIFITLTTTAIVYLPPKLMVDIISLTFLSIICGLLVEFIYSILTGGKSGSL